MEWSEGAGGGGGGVQADSPPLAHFHGFSKSDCSVVLYPAFHSSMKCKIC